MEEPTPPPATFESLAGSGDWIALDALLQRTAASPSAAGGDAAPGFNVLRLAVSKGAPLQTVQLILDAAGNKKTSLVSAVSTVWPNKALLHFVSKQTSPEGELFFSTLRTLLASAGELPGAFRRLLRRMAEQRFSLSCCLRFLAVVNVLLQLVPALATSRDKMGYTALHEAVANCASAAVVELLAGGQSDRVLTTATGSAYNLGEERSTPLHMVTTETQAAAVEALLKLAPTACLALNKQQQAPLHSAAHAHCQPDVLRTPLNADFAAVTKKDSLGRLPLHMAVLSQWPASAVAATHLGETTRLLVEANRSACAEALPAGEKSGRWPLLHLAVANSYPAQVVTAILAAYPSAASKSDTLGMTPLHCCVSTAAATAEVMEALIAADAAQCAAPDKTAEKNLPLHLCVEHCPDAAVAAALIRANPAAPPLTKTPPAASRSTASAPTPPPA